MHSFPKEKKFEKLQIIHDMAKEVNLDFDFAIPHIEILIAYWLTPLLFPVEFRCNVRPEASRVLNRPFVHLQVLTTSKRDRVRSTHQALARVPQRPEAQKRKNSNLENRGKKNSYLLRRWDKGLLAKFITGEDEIVLFGGESFAEDHSIQVRDPACPGGQGGQRIHMAQVVRRGQAPVRRAAVRSHRIVRFVRCHRRLPGTGSEVRTSRKTAKVAGVEVVKSGSGKKWETFTCHRRIMTLRKHHPWIMF